MLPVLSLPCTLQGACVRASAILCCVFLLFNALVDVLVVETPSGQIGPNFFWRYRGMCNLPDCDTVSRWQGIDGLSEQKKLTVVLMSYSTSRDVNYKQLLYEYTSIPHIVDRVVFVWNNQRRSPPQHNYHGVEIVNARRNDMMNRWLLSDRLVHTDAILVVDDDVLILSGLLQCMMTVHRRYPDAIVGLDERHVAPSTGNYYHHHKGSDHNRSSVAIGKTMLISTRLYSAIASAPPSLLALASTKGGPCHSCDDLVVNAIVSNLTEAGPVYISPDVMPHVRLDLPSPGGVSSSDAWYGPHGRRSQCVRHLSKVFGRKRLFHPSAAKNELRCES